MLISSVGLISLCRKEHPPPWIIFWPKSNIIKGAQERSVGWVKRELVDSQTHNSQKSTTHNSQLTTHDCSCQDTTKQPTHQRTHPKAPKGLAQSALARAQRRLVTNNVHSEPGFTSRVLNQLHTQVLCWRKFSTVRVGAGVLASQVDSLSWASLGPMSAEMLHAAQS